MSARGISAVCLNGSMSLEERKQVQAAFAGEIRVLVSTDAGGEGLNLEFCHVVIDHISLESHGGEATRTGKTWKLSFPTGEQIHQATFSAQSAEAVSTAQHLTLEDPRVRGLTTG